MYHNWKYLPSIGAHTTSWCLLIPLAIHALQWPWVYPKLWSCLGGFWRLCCTIEQEIETSSCNFWSSSFLEVWSVVTGVIQSGSAPPKYYFAISKFSSTRRVNSKFAYGCDLLKHRALYFQSTGRGSGGRLWRERVYLDPSNGWLKSMPISVDDQWKDEEHYGYHGHKVWFDCSMISIPFGVVRQSHVFVWHEPHIDA